MIPLKFDVKTRSFWSIFFLITFSKLKKLIRKMRISIFSIHHFSNSQLWFKIFKSIFYLFQSNSTRKNWNHLREKNGAFKAYFNPKIFFSIAILNSILFEVVNVSCGKTMYNWRTKIKAFKNTRITNFIIVRYFTLKNLVYDDRRNKTLIKIPQQFNFSRLYFKNTKKKWSEFKPTDSNYVHFQHLNFICLIISTLFFFAVVPISITERISLLP